MKFWTDASPIVKISVAVLVVGVIGVIGFQMVADPYEGAELNQDRGLSSAE